MKRGKRDLSSSSSYVQVGSHEMHAWSRAKLHNGTVTVLPLPDRFGPQTAKKINTKSISWNGGVLAGAAPATGCGGLVLGPARGPRLVWVSFVEALDSALTAFHVLL